MTKRQEYEPDEDPCRRRLAQTQEQTTVSEQLTTASEELHDSESITRKVRQGRYDQKHKGSEYLNIRQRRGGAVFYLPDNAMVKLKIKSKEEFDGKT